MATQLKSLDAPKDQSAKYITAEDLERFRSEVKLEAKQELLPYIDQGDQTALRKVQEIAKPQAMVMAVEIDTSGVKKLKNQAVPFLDKMITHAKLSKHTGQHSLLVGPAGCGKTFAAKQLSEALNQEFHSLCFTVGASETWLFGRQTPKGFVEGGFTKAYRNGGVFLADEIDNADPNMLIAINTALANGELANPINGETIQRHDDFVFVGAANTFGKGADMQYTGRNRLDAATLDRFIPIAIDYDTKLETQLCPDTDLRRLLQNIRKELLKRSAQEIVSTRFIKGAYLRAQNGEPVSDIIESLTLSWSDDLKEMAQNKLKAMNKKGESNASSNNNDEEQPKASDLDHHPF